MANLLESSQTQATTAPDYYNTHLQNLATSGAKAVTDARFVGAQPLQEKAYGKVEAAGGSYVPQLTKAEGTVDKAIASTSPLDAGAQYLNRAANFNPADTAGSYMSPFARTAAGSLSDISQRNIQQNVSPNAVAAAVGAGQFGSQRGAQVLGQLQANERQNLNSQIAQMMNTGYGQALNAATAQGNLLGQVGATSGTQASETQKNLGALATTQGNMAEAEQKLGLADVNALSTMGEQQRLLKQKEQEYPLTKLQDLSTIMQGYQIPTSTETKLNMSPLSALGSLTSLGAGLFTHKYDSAGRKIENSSLWDQIKGAVSGATSGGGGGGGGLGGGPIPGLNPVLPGELEPPEGINPTPVLPGELEPPEPIIDDSTQIPGYTPPPDYTVSPDYPGEFFTLPVEPGDFGDVVEPG
jgi:hypothetical protein